MKRRRVTTAAEAAEVAEKAARAVEAATGVGGCVVHVPVELGGQTFVSTYASGSSVKEQLELMRGALPALVAHMAHAYRIKMGEEMPDLDPMGVGHEPPPEVFAAAQLAMEVLRDGADGVLLVVHRKARAGEDNRLDGGCMALANPACEHGDEFERLAEMAPGVVNKWSVQVKEILGERGSRPVS